MEDFKKGRNGLDKSVNNNKQQEFGHNKGQQKSMTSENTRDQQKNTMNSGNKNYSNGNEKREQSHYFSHEKNASRPMHDHKNDKSKSDCNDKKNNCKPCR